MNIQHCGYVAIIGRPNVGKSTLLNALVGKKISITSRKPQTTRMQIMGIKTQGEQQAVYIDTPGIHTAEKRAMNRYMNRLANAVIADTDVIVFMIAAPRWHAEDEMILEKLASVKTPVILLINKVDLLPEKAQLLPWIEGLSAKYPFAHIVPLCARKMADIERLQSLIFTMLPPGPFLFPIEQMTDKNERFQVAELIREKLLKTTGQELPYSTTVVIESWKKEAKRTVISAIIWVEREGQKAIVIGKNGERLKLIGTQARKEIEHLLDAKVFLHLWVKVKSDWTDNELALQTLGYE